MRISDWSSDVCSSDLEKDHPPSIPDFQPAYLASESYQKNGYHCEELNGGVYWVTDGGYDTSFVVTDTCVIAIDAPPTLGENMLAAIERSEEHTSELQSRMSISYAVFSLKKNNNKLPSIDTPLVCTHVTTCYTISP